MGNKYITTDNLKYFYNQLKEKRFVAQKDFYGGIKLNFEPKENDEYKNYKHPVELDNEGRAYVQVLQDAAIIPEATTSTSGLMSYRDKSKLDNIEAGANKYTLPTATKDILGGIKIGTTDEFTDVVQNDNRRYAVKLSASGHAYVNIPWVNTEYSIATKSRPGLMSTEDKRKLDDLTGGGSASDYILPTATNDVLGGIKLGFEQVDNKYPVKLDSEKAYVEIPSYTLPKATDKILGGIKIGYIKETGEDRNYAVQLNNNGYAYVNVPWISSNYTLPIATTNVLGGIKIGTTVSETEQNMNRKYAVQLDSNEHAYVNVPWIDTITTIPIASERSLGGIKIGTTLSETEQNTNRKYAVNVVSNHANDDGYGYAYVNVPWSDTTYTHPTDGKNTGNFGSSTSTTLTYGGTFSVPYITVNNKGHVTAASTTTFTLPSAPSTSASTYISAPSSRSIELDSGKNSSCKGIDFLRIFKESNETVSDTNAPKGVNFGNALRVGGKIDATNIGAGELLMEWIGNDASKTEGEAGKIYYRSQSNVGPWSNWVKLLDERDLTTVSTTSNGLMSKEDKIKLDGIESGANKYDLPEAASDELGGIYINFDELKTESDVRQDFNRNHGDIEKAYAVKTYNAAAYVEVPWTQNYPVMESDDFFDISGNIENDNWLCYKCELEPNHITVVKKDYIDRWGAKTTPAKSYTLGPVIINLPNPKNLSKTHTTKFELMIDIDNLESTYGKGTALANGWYNTFGYDLNFGNNGNGNCLPPYVLWENNEMPCILGSIQTDEELENKSGLYKFTFTYVPNPWAETIEEGSDEELGKFYGKYEFWKQTYY